MSIGRARRGSGEIRLAAGCTRNPGRRMIQPLGIHRRDKRRAQGDGQYSDRRCSHVGGAPWPSLRNSIQCGESGRGGPVNLLYLAPMSETASAKADNMPPEARLIEMVMAQVVTRLVHVAAKLDLADKVAAGPKTAEELAQATSTHAP